MVLIFQHDIMHEGSTLVKGRKYSVRTDVMFTAENTYPYKHKPPKVNAVKKETQDAD